MEFSKIMGQVNDWGNFFEYLADWVIEPSKEGIYSKSFVEECFSINKMKYYIKDILGLKIIQPNFCEMYVWFADIGLVNFKSNNFEQLLFEVIAYAKSF